MKEFQPHCVAASSMWVRHRWTGLSSESWTTAGPAPGSNMEEDFLASLWPPPLKHNNKSNNVRLMMHLNSCNEVKSTLIQFNYHTHTQTHTHTRHNAVKIVAIMFEFKILGKCTDIAPLRRGMWKRLCSHKLCTDTRHSQGLTFYEKHIYEFWGTLKLTSNLSCQINAVG